MGCHPGGTSQRGAFEFRVLGQEESARVAAHGLHLHQRGQLHDRGQREFPSGE